MGKLFGTNGVRGFANEDMSAELAMKLGKSLGSFLKPGEVVLVGADTRTSGPMLKAALAAGLLATGVRVKDAGVCPTPALQYRVKNARYAAGTIVTASHNPPEHNGIKFIDGDGTEMPASKEDAIEEIFFGERFRAAAWSALSGVESEVGVNEAYVSGVLSQVDVAAIRARKLRVVIDTSNGAGSLTGPYVLRDLGCQVVTLNAQPDGTFPGHPSEPTPENVKDLVKAVMAFGCDLGVVQDGDADRCVFVTEKGEFVDGNKILALMAAHAVKKAGGKGTVVTPVSSSLIVEEHVRRHGGNVVYTRVGAPVVARKMQEIGAIFGGEENGGLIWPKFQHCRDASMTLAAIVEAVVVTGKPLSVLLADLPQATMVKLKLACPNEKKAKALAALAAAHKKDRVDTTDGVKVTTSEGWVLVRPSGTEPIYRVYAEAKTAEAAQELGKKFLAEIEGIIRSV